MGRKAMKERIARIGKEEHVRRADKARLWVYDRWHNRLVKRKTFTLQMFENRRLNVRND